MNDNENKANFIDSHPVLNLSNPAQLNVLSADRFKQRITEIFTKTANALAKSYGPYGSSTIISDYPFSHVTKDGFNIMKKLSFSKEFTVVDDALKNLITAPCERLNYSVGDGTTTAIISVNAIYQQYMAHYELFKSLHVAPRDILKAYNKIRNRIIDKLNDEVVMIDTSDHQSMVELMKGIAYISSNGDDEVTDIIGDLYDALDYPVIEITKASDGITKKKVVKGYQFDAILRDNLYVNNDNFTGKYKNVDVLIFDHKITHDTFNRILLPLNEECRKLNRKLICIAPSYDDVAMLTIARNLTSEFQTIGSINLILMVGRMVSGVQRNLTEDLALVLNTNIITMTMENLFIDKLITGADIRSIFDINNRNIEGLTVSVKDLDGKPKWTKDNGKIDESDKVTREVTLDPDGIRVGFAGSVVLGMKDGSVFDSLQYDKELYNKQIDVLEHELKELKKKSEAVTTFNFAAKDIESRLFKLRMKIGTIEVGGESGLSQDLLRDAVDDTVKATASAYHNGIVCGCSVATLRAIHAVINDILNEGAEPLYVLLSRIICDGFESVYKTLLSSKFDNFSLHNHFMQIFSITDKDGNIISNGNWNDYPNTMTFGEENILYEYAKLTYPILTTYCGYTEDFNTYWYLFQNTYKREDGIYEIDKIYIESVYDHIINMSIKNNLPFNLVTGSFDSSIINSAKTDKEILLASSDLMSLLITGNQMIIADH